MSAHTSYSAINTFVNCGEQYRLTKVEKVPEIGAFWSWGGSAVHKVTEVYDLLEFAGEADGFRENIPARFALALEHEMNDRPKADFPPRSSKNQGEEWWLENGPRMVEDYMDWRTNSGWEVATTFDGVPAIELKVNLEVGGLPLLGYVDRVMMTPDGDLVVMDIKTGSSKPKSHLQLGMYSVMLSENYGLDVDYGAYYMARKAEVVDAEPLNLYDLEYLDRLVSGFKKARDAEAYVANPASMLCGVCGVAYACYAKGGTDADLYKGGLLDDTNPS